MRLSAAKVLVLALFAFVAFGSQTIASAGGIGVVKLLKCKRDVDPANRFISISGYMTSNADEKISIKVELLKKDQGSASYSVVQTPLIGSWEEAASGVSNYKVKKRIANLTGPARYRAQVTFRWVDNASGSTTVLMKRSKVCSQTDARSDLITKSIGDPISLPVAAARYPAVIENKGSTIASNFKLALSIDGVAQPSAYVPRLLPGAERVIPVEGIRCFQGSQLVFTADAENSVSEADETNNSLTINCPMAVSTTGLLG